MTLLRKIVIPNYVRSVQLSEKRRAKYYERGDKLPAYIQKKLEQKVYKYKKKKVSKKNRWFLVDENEERVISNPRVAGQPRMKLINGQYLYKGSVHSSVRRKMIEAIKDSFRSHLLAVDPLTLDELPVRINVEVHDQIRDPQLKNQLWDLDNRFWPYQKAFQDILIDMKIIPEDHVFCITGPPAPLFYPIGPGVVPKLVFKIKKDDRKSIREHKEYQDYFARNSSYLNSRK